MNAPIARRALVVGTGIAGAAVARQLVARGTEVVAVDDDPAAGAPVENLGIPFSAAPPEQDATAFVEPFDLLVPSPGVPPRHALVRAARAAGVRVWGELELAARWSSLPLVAITGTNGKTTVTTLVVEMLTASGRRAAAVGNTDIPLVDVLDAGLDVAVVEASSFRLYYSETFRPRVSAWLNLAPDHLDWHEGLDHYIAAKARIWANQGEGDTALANAEDAVVMAEARRVNTRVVTFGVSEGEWRVEAGALAAPGAGAFAPVESLPRALPHDLANALAASAAATAAGADLGSCADVLRAFGGLPHRVTLVRDAGGVRWYDDSKSTTPASVLAAVRGFSSVVLIAGGRNKGLDLSVLADAAPPVRAVVAIGEASGEVAAAFSGRVPVVVAGSMERAVAAAADVAERGDVVLLSPACASFDQYRSYKERGDEFVALVKALPVGARR